MAAQFTLNEGESQTFLLQIADPGDHPARALTAAESDALLAQTVDYWLNWIAKCNYTGRWREMVQRSALALGIAGLRTHGRHRCRSHHQPSGADWRGAKLGLPLQLDSRFRFHGLCAVARGADGRSGPLHDLAGVTVRPGRPGGRVAANGLWNRWAGDLAGGDRSAIGKATGARVRFASGTPPTSSSRWTFTAK